MNSFSLILVFFTLALGLDAFAQDSPAKGKSNDNSKVVMPDYCDSITESSYDKMTDETDVASNKIMFAYSGSSLVGTLPATKFKGLIYPMIIQTHEKMCISKGKGALFLFRDGTRITRKNLYKSNCDPSLVLILDHDDEFIKAAISKKIEAVRIYHDSGAIDFEYPIEVSERISKVMACVQAASIIKNSKSKSE
jgi:hypothetical protein